MKLAFVVQRYGRDILGGSETLARQLAERLGRRHDITVLTTTAKDYITWKNEYEPGEEKHRGVRILRFPVVGERVLEEFNKFSEEIYGGNATREQELEWLHRQGPVVPELVEYLRKEQERFDLIVFFTYLYYPTYYGLQVAPEKSVLVPTAHDEPPLRLGIFREMFQLPSSFLFNTEAEEVLVLDRFPVHKKMRETIGMGMDLLELPDTGAFRRKHNIPGLYLLYAGRIDAGKGLEELFRYFTFYKEENPASGNLQLILIGRLSMKLPEDPSIRYIGFVDEGDKLSAMAGAAAVVQPSTMESLSIVTLEAFSVGTPAIVNAASRVLADHCRKANAGFFYRDFEEFEAILDLLFSDRGLGKALGKNGQRYVKDNYGWSKLLAKYELALRASARPGREPKSAKAASATIPVPAPPQESEAPTERESPPSEHVSEEETPEESSVAADEELVEEATEAEPVESSSETASSSVSETDEPRLESHPSRAPEAEPEPERERERAWEREREREPEPEPEPEPALETAEAGEETMREDESDETETALPSFYRSSIPPEPPARVPAASDTTPSSLPPPAPSQEAGASDSGSRPAKETKPEPESEPLEPGELPEFFRPRKADGDGD